MEKCEIVIVGGVEGDSIYLNNHRLAGPKPWGGGTVKKKWTTDIESIEAALGMKFRPKFRPGKRSTPKESR